MDFAQLKSSKNEPYFYIPLFCFVLTPLLFNCFYWNAPLTVKTKLCHLKEARTSLEIRAGAFSFRGELSPCV